VRRVHVNTIKKAVKELTVKANQEIPKSAINLFKEALEKEESPLGREVLQQILENAEIAKLEQMPYCQDTGITVVFLEIGQEVVLEGGDIIKAINEGVKEATEEGYLRASVVWDPIFERKNTGDNTPAVIHWETVPGDRIKISIAPKGAGSENTSRLAMLKPSDGWEGVKDFILQTVEKAGPNACPPLTVGIGIGGNFEYCAYLAKKALLRTPGERHSDPMIRKMEEELLEEINKLGLGPMGFGGRTTAVDVKVEMYPCHIASLPVAVNIQCHAIRHAEKEL